VPEGCAADFDQSAFGLAGAPRVGEYRGFVFASLANNGLSFEDHIGPMKRNIDDLVDRAPDGELALDAGMHRYVYAGNWKLQVENVLDSYHVPFGHASTVNKQGVQFARREGDRKGATVVKTDKKQTAASWKEAQELHRRQRPRLDQQHRARRRQTRKPRLRQVQARAGGEKVGSERAQQILNSLIYPNMSIMGLNILVRVIKPVAVDRTQVTIYPIRLVGAPAAMNFGNIRLLNVTHSAASFVQTDDLESFVRAQKGLRSRLTEWVDISRGPGSTIDCAAREAACASCKSGSISSTATAPLRPWRCRFKADDGGQTTERCLSVVRRLLSRKLFDRFCRARRAVPAQKFQFLCLERIRRLKESFQLFGGAARKMPDIQQVAFERRAVGNREGAVVALLLSVFGLFHLQDADKLAAKHQAGIGRGIVNDENIERIPIRSFCRRNEAPVVW
jgi:phenylpropionate dioxygenase-like ring-hydroxylating dioxygenase large terminal subunit